MKLAYFSLFLTAMFYSCSEPATQPVQLQTDTLISLHNTDTANYRKLSFLLGDYDQGYELQTIDGENFTPYSKTMFGYDENMNKDLIINSLYDFSKSKFVNSTKQEFAFDKIGNPIEIVNFVDKADKWIPVDKIINKYDTKKNILSTEKFTYCNKDFLPLSKEEMKYDSKNNPIEIVAYLSDSTGKWIPQDKKVQEFKEKLLVLCYDYKPKGKKDWILVSKVEHAYDYASKKISSVSYIKSESSSKEWINNVRVDYQYDSISGNMTSAHTMFWDEKKSKWKSYDIEDF